MPGLALKWLTFEFRVLSLTDSGTGTDSFTLSGKPALSDAGAGSDVLTTLKGKPVVSDSGSGADTFTLKGKPSVSDSGSGSDTFTLKGKPALLDTGSGTDSLTLKGKPSLSDSGSAVDAVSLKARPSLSDAGMGADSVSLSASLRLRDLGAGIDSVSISVSNPPPSGGSGGGYGYYLPFYEPETLETAVDTEAPFLLARALEAADTERAIVPVQEVRIDLWDAEPDWDRDMEEEYLATYHLVNGYKVVPITQTEEVQIHKAPIRLTLPPPRPPPAWDPIVVLVVGGALVVIGGVTAYVLWKVLTKSKHH